MPNVLVVDAWLPTPDRDGASLQMVQLLGLLRERAGGVTFAGDDLSPQRPSRQTLAAAGITVLDQTGPAAIEAHLASHGRDYDLVILSRLHVASKYWTTVRRLAPRARLVFDTTDLHFLRTFRAARVSGNASLLRQALVAKRVELTLVRAADCTLVVSPAEQALLASECPDAPVQLLSLIYPVQPTVPPFAERSGLLFVGAFPHHPNADAMEHFCHQVQPLLRQRLGRLTTTVIGSQPPAWLSALAADDLVVAGHVPDLAPYLRRARISIAPLRYGAGIKSKVLLSLSYGLPVVASPIAAEGLIAQPGRDLLIADHPAEWCDQIAALDQDPALWQRLSDHGRQLCAERFSLAAARASLAELFERLGLTAPANP
jgi:glycosyltransferase involved in cell wall biosynthesis